MAANADSSVADLRHLPGEVQLRGRSARAGGSGDARGRTVHVRHLPWARSREGGAGEGAGERRPRRAGRGARA